jgi:hypothetical protein
MHNIFDQGLIKYLDIIHNYTLNMKNENFGIINQHMNVTCHMQDLEKKLFTLVALVPKIMNAPIYVINRGYATNIPFVCILLFFVLKCFVKFNLVKCFFS